MPYEYEGGFGSTIVPDIASTTTPLRGIKEGSFPRIHLTSGENILWEAKPALLPYILKPVIYGIIGIVLAIIVGQEEEDFALLMLIIVAVAMPIGIAMGIVSQRRTSFALTNRRIMTQYGVFSQKFADCGHDKVQNSTIVRSMMDRVAGWGSIVFATAGTMGGIKTRHAKKMMSFGGAVLWLHVKYPIPVYKYAQEVMESSKKLAKAQDYHLMAGILKKESPVTHRLEPVPAEPAGEDEFGYCTHCGKKTKMSWKYCRHCGKEPY